MHSKILYSLLTLAIVLSLPSIALSSVSLTKESELEKQISVTVAL